MKVNCDGRRVKNAKKELWKCCWKILQYLAYDTGTLEDNPLDHSLLRGRTAKVKARVNVISYTEGIIRST